MGANTETYSKHEVERGPKLDSSIVSLPLELRGRGTPPKRSQRGQGYQENTGNRISSTGYIGSVLGILC